MVSFIPIIGLWSKMVKNGKKWSKMVKNGQKKYKKWSKMVKKIYFFSYLCRHDRYRVFDHFLPLAPSSLCIHYLYKSWFYFTLRFNYNNEFPFRNHTIFYTFLV